MARKDEPQLSRRERQIMEIVYRKGNATAAEVHEGMPDRPSYSAVRALLRVLEGKGHLRHREDGPRYVYAPTVPRDRARRSALQRVVGTFFAGSVTDAVAALLDLESAHLDGDELERLSALVAEAQLKGK
ncbi:MAG TPA: BlaI/MecI/CopY family transcriptional regulator [Thermoanaerobaculia bacterium]|nr:BlaI/MecI/CopY family transcriptional regulator [Thermoanaerobaculia bacterium]HXT51629.1 BlaI/MecI/CopY family transcriptional regulator [Thermoanaerobaculia bacterium]